jgi:hypothetical protein
MLHYDIPEELHKELKRLALDQDMTLKALVLAALTEYLERHRPKKTR